MIRILTLAALAAALAGCAGISPRPFTGPNGKAAYSMQCSGMGRTLQDCYRKAGELCPAGYALVDRVSGTGGVVPVGGVYVAVQQHSLAIECR